MRNVGASWLWAAALGVAGCGASDDGGESIPVAADAGLDADAAKSPEPGPDPDAAVAAPDAEAPAPDAAPEPDAAPPPPGLAVLGDGAHTVDAVDLKRIAGRLEGLDEPRDLGINPEAPEQLWILNQAQESMVVVFDHGEPGQRARKYRSRGGTHFMPRGAGLAFGQPGFMATVHEESEITQPTTPEDFMGPTLWPTDLELFDAGHASHLDMLHNSPDAVGIAWDTGNAYWVFDGYHRALARYDFGRDHGPGQEDHSDGEVLRYAEGEVGYVENVPSHLAFDAASKLLYVADTGNGRVAVLDTQTGRRGRPIFPNYDGGTQYHVNDADIRTLVDGLERPSGIALHDGVLFVGDNGTSKLYAYDLDGRLLDWLDLGSHVRAGGLMGIEVDAQGRVYVVDGVGDAVLRISAR